MKDVQRLEDKGRKKRHLKEEAKRKVVVKMKSPKEEEKLFSFFL